MRGVQKKLLVIMPQYMSTARKQLKYQMTDMVEVIDNTPILNVLLILEKLMIGA